MYEIYGLKIGEREVESFRVLAGTKQGTFTWSGERKTVFFYMWCIKGMGEVILFDTGMEDVDLFMPGRVMTDTVSAQDALDRFGVDPLSVKTVILSHMHPDHFSAHALYPNARFWIQKKEVAFWATLQGDGKTFRQEIRIGEIIELNRRGRVQFLDGDAEIRPGITVTLVGGHTPGHQVVSVATAAGTVVLCADSVDFYCSINHEIRNKTSGGTDEDDALSFKAFDTIRALASSPELIIPGHDPLLMEKYPRVGEGMFKVVAR